MISRSHKNLIEKIKKSDLSEYKNLENLFHLAQIILQEDEENKEYCLKISKFVKEYSKQLVFEKLDTRFDDLYWATLKFEAPHLFKSFLYYMERNRTPDKRFFQPREQTLNEVVQDLQDLEDGKIDFYGLSLPPRTGKSTLCTFFLAWVMGKRPNSHNAMGGHSGVLAKPFFKEILNLISAPGESQYTFYDIFPSVKLESKSADDLTVNLNDPDKNATFTARGIDGTWTGAVDVSTDGYLYVDDLVRDRTESLSPIRLNSRYQDYLNVMVDRKKDGARELMVGTRWNVMDPLGRIESANKDNPRCRFRKIPALNEKGESNFQYKHGVGFSTEYYQKLKERLDKNEWEAKYQQRPFVREGLLFPEDELRYYNGILPEEGFVGMVAVVDVAWGGGDSLSMPIGAEFENGDVYITDWVFSTGKKEYTVPIVAGKIMANKIQQINFEANNGGDMYEGFVSDKFELKRYKCSCTHTRAPNQLSKMSKIIQYSGDIIKHFVFLEPDKRSEEYQKAVDELCMFVQIGKNEHDDAADSLAQLERFISNGVMAQCRVMPRPF